jgi:hypothetical protein
MNSNKLTEIPNPNITIVEDPENLRVQVASARTASEVLAHFLKKENLFG